MSVASFETDTASRVALLSRIGTASVPGPATVLQQDDLIHVMVSGAGLEQVDALFRSQEAH